LLTYFSKSHGGNKRTPPEERRQVNNRYFIRGCNIPSIWFEAAFARDSAKIEKFLQDDLICNYEELINNFSHKLRSISAWESKVKTNGFWLYRLNVSDTFDGILNIVGRITTPLLNLIMTLITLVTNSSLSGRL
jgi:hypothetical protein